MMTEPRDNGDRDRKPSLVGCAAIVAAVAMLILACAGLIIAFGWWQGRQLSSDALDPDTSADAGQGQAGQTPDSGSSEASSSAAYPPGAQADASMDDGSDQRMAGPPLRVPGANIVTVVEDWRAFAYTGANVVEIERNRGAGDDNWMTLSVLDESQSPGGQGGLAIDYAIGEESPDDFVGFNRRHVPSQDWRGATHLALWAHAADTAPLLVVQFRESSGEVWRHTLSVPEIPPVGPIMLPLDAESFEHADWSAPGNEAFDLTAIDQYGIYLGHVGPAISGTLRLGPIAAVRQEAGS